MFNKKKKVVIVFILSLSLFFTTLLGNNSTTVSAKDNEEKLVRSILNQYEIAAKEFNIDNMVDLSLDLSWPNPDQFKDGLKNLKEKVYKFETINLVKVENDLYHATVLAETDALEETTLEIPVLKLNGKWKVIVGQDLDDETQHKNSASYPFSKSIKSANFYKEYFTNYNSYNSNQFQALSNSVKYYSFSFSYVNSIDTTSWTNTNSTPTIKGYQMPNGGHGSWIDIDYQLRKKGAFGSYSALSPDATVNFTGTYSQTGTWYQKQWYGIPTDISLLLRITNNDNSYYVYGAGNVYN